MRSFRQAGPAALALSLLLIGPALARTTAAAKPAAKPARSYAECVAKADAAPADGLAYAQAWAAARPDPAAEHCAAIAEAALGRFDAAAARLEKLAVQAKDEDEAVGLYDQLGVVRLDQGMTDRAIDAYTTGLARYPKSLALLTGRARAYAVAEAWPKVTHDLTLALSLDPDDPRILLLYATAMRKGGHPEDGKPLIERAADIDPASPAILLERGNIRWSTGDEKGALADWTQVVGMAPSGQSHDAAQQNLDSYRSAGIK